MGENWNGVPDWLRDTVLFVAGLAGTAHETLAVEEPRTVLLVMFSAMMGVPAFFRNVRLFKSRKDKVEQDVGI